MDQVIKRVESSRTALVPAAPCPGIGPSSPTGSAHEELQRVIRSESEKWEKTIEVPGARAK